MDKRTLESLLQNNGLAIRLEPVVSLRQKLLVGYEGRLVPPAGFATARDFRDAAFRVNLGVELDRWFRRASLRVFQSLTPPRGLLFLNFDTSILDQGVGGSGKVAALVAEHGLSPSEVVICCRESEVTNQSAFDEFVARHRAMGFLLALKGVGDGHSNLERLSRARPDILKFGEGLIGELPQDFVRQEIVKSLVTLSRKIGALVVAEGVADETQVMACLSSGIDMVQGPFWRETATFLEDQLTPLADRHKKFDVEARKKASERARAFDAWMTPLVKFLSTAPSETWETHLREALATPGAPSECAYLLDEEGNQISDTLTRPGVHFKTSPLFRPAQKGADHSLKEYFYLLNDTFVTRYRTDPYVSLASGNLCITCSAMAKPATGTPIILCIDFPI